MAENKTIIYIREVAVHCGIEEEIIHELMEMGLLTRRGETEDNFFEPEDLTLLRRIRRLKEDMGVNLAGIEVILHMREQILNLHRQLQSSKHSSYTSRDEDDIMEL